MTPRLFPALVLAPLAFLSPLHAQGRSELRDTPNRPNAARRAEPQQAPQGGQLNANERERLIRAVRELRQQVDALQQRVDEMASRSPRGPNGRPDGDRARRDHDQRPGRGPDQSAAPGAGRIVERIRAMRGAVPMRGEMLMRGRALRGRMPMAGQNPMRGRMMQGRMPMPGFSPMPGPFGGPDWSPMQGEAPQRGRRGQRRADEGRPVPQEIEIEGVVIPEAGDEDVRVWVQGPDGLPGGQPMFLRQLMQGGDVRGEDLPEPIRVMMQRRGGQPGGEGAGQLRERIRQRVLEQVEEAVEESTGEGEARPARRASRRKA